MSKNDSSNPDNMVGVIMAGGAGTRFWPASTQDRPKQFLSLFGANSLLQQSYERLASYMPPERILVLTNDDFVGLVRMQLPQLPIENVIGEPLRRDTAAAITLASALAAHRFGDPVMTIVTSDHLIDPVEEFRDTMLSAARGAEKSDALYTFGIAPDHPSTGFGYLKLGDSVDNADGAEHFELDGFVEKPDLETAKGYLADGGYAWNSGMFVWRASAVMNEVRRQLPDHAEKIENAVLHDGRPDFSDSLRQAFEPLDKVSIDFGVMEHARSVRAVRASFAWYDVGSFPALADHLPTDETGNAHRGRLFGIDSHDNIVFSEDDEEVVALLGMSDVVVVRAGKRTLVAPRARAEEIKALVASLDEDLR